MNDNTTLLVLTVGHAGARIAESGPTFLSTYVVYSIWIFLDPLLVVVYGRKLNTAKAGQQNLQAAEIREINSKSLWLVSRIQDANQTLNVTKYEEEDKEG